MKNTILLKRGRDSIELELRHICYIEAYNRHLKYYLDDGDMLEVVGKLDDVCNELESHGFIRSHKSFMVNMLYIKRFGDDCIYLKNGGYALMSTRKKTETKKKYYSYLNN